MEYIKAENSSATTVQDARDDAIGCIPDKVASPVVLSWYDEERGEFAPDIPGGDPKTRWRDYGVSLGGEYEVEVNNRFHFIVGSADKFTEPKIKFTNVTDKSGRKYLCIDVGDKVFGKRSLDEVYAAGGGKGGV